MKKKQELMMRLMKDKLKLVRAIDDNGKLLVVFGIVYFEANNLEEVEKWIDERDKYHDV